MGFRGFAVSARPENAGVTGSTISAALFPLAFAAALLLFLKTPFREAGSEVPSVFAYAPATFLKSGRQASLVAGFMSGTFLFATLFWAHWRLGAYRPPYAGLGALGWQVLVLIPVAVALRFRHTGMEGGRLRRDAATLPLLAGLALIPTSLMDAAPFHALFYLVAALSLLLTSSGGAGADEFSRRWARTMLVGLAGGILFFAFAQVRDAWTISVHFPP